jgi:hypothetical protein
MRDAFFFFFFFFSLVWFGDRVWSMESKEGFGCDVDTAQSAITESDGRGQRTVSVSSWMWLRCRCLVPAVRWTRDLSLSISLSASASVKEGKRMKLKRDPLTAVRIERKVFSQSSSLPLSFTLPQLTHQLRIGFLKIPVLRCIKRKGIQEYRNRMPKIRV